MNLFAAGVCLLTSYVCLQFVLIEHEFGVNAFALLPNWLVAIVLPLAFAVVGLRYLAPCREWQCFPAGGSSMILAATLSLLAAMLLGAPLFSVIFGGALLDFYAIEVDLSVVIAVDTPLLSSLPLFTSAGYLLSESNTSQRVLRLVRALFGWMPDGLAIVPLLACAMFTALTGASGVTIVALGALLLPALLKAGYQERFSLGLITSSGSLGLLLMLVLLATVLLITYWPALSLVWVDGK